jgi:hypothetical protein
VLGLSENLRSSKDARNGYRQGFRDGLLSAARSVEDKAPTVMRSFIARLRESAFRLVPRR